MTSPLTRLMFWYPCTGDDIGRVARALREHPFVAPESVVEVPEGHRVLYTLDELSVSRAEIAAADQNIRNLLARVVSAHRYPL